ncbi:protein ANTI-SILENCING 1 isoform X2 [Momordica charantia]|uniref:Protein ANTI-SILENCING 1 isoform X2 n=1 Tax=Momordica charantia TaxID=3673 RepID=A0A6J1DH56_MOMCH|nr:protein ANTI-SILENCING 1 isoform X2 [Momordica charantia]
MVLTNMEVLVQTMLHVGERNVKNEFGFKWGLKTKVVKEKGYQFYESFLCNGLEYFLYDCVYIYHRGDCETTIGRLVKMFETRAHEQKVKVVRFMRPIELRDFPRDFEPRWNEIFLASGESAGVSKCYLLEEVIRKCNVVCTLKDGRNPQPSDAELNSADYIFYRTYDVKKCMILEDFPDEIDHIKVECLFNREPDARQSNQKTMGELGGNSSLPKFGREIICGSKSQMASSDNVEVSPCKKTKLLSDGNGRNVGSVKGAYNVKASEISKRAAPQLKLIQDKRRCKSTQLLQVTKKLIIDRSKWFKQPPWEHRLRQAQEVGTLVLLENLDSTLSSSEVEELVQKALKQKVDANMLPCSSISNPHYGKALVIFKSKAAAETALSDLTKRCLMLSTSDGSGFRPVVGSRGFLADSSKRVNFVGHLSLPKLLRQKYTMEMKNAISTSHCSQPNTVEWDLAMEWRLLQERSDLWWKKLHANQNEEVLNLKRQLKLK